MLLEQRTDLRAAVRKPDRIRAQRWPAVLQLHVTAHQDGKLREVRVPICDGTRALRQKTEAQRLSGRFEAIEIERNRISGRRCGRRTGALEDRVIRNALVARSERVTARQDVVAPDRVVRVLAPRRGRSRNDEVAVPSRGHSQHEAFVCAIAPHRYAAGDRRRCGRDIRRCDQRFCIAGRVDARRFGDGRTEAEAEVGNLLRRSDRGSQLWRQQRIRASGTGAQKHERSEC